MLGGKEGAAHMHGLHAVEDVVRIGFDRRDDTEIAGIRKQHVDAAEPFRRAADIGLGLRGVGDIGDDEFDFRTARHRRGRLLESGLVAIDQRKARALFEKQPGGCPAEAAGAAGDDARPAFKLPHARPPQIG